MAPIQMGRTGKETFQLLVDGARDKTLYPSVPNAGPFEAHTVLGPDARGTGKTWCIGRFAEEEAGPGVGMFVMAALDSKGKIRAVDWQPC